MVLNSYIYLLNEPEVKIHLFENLSCTFNKIKKFISEKSLFLTRGGHTLYLFS